MEWMILSLLITFWLPIFLVISCYMATEGFEKRPFSRRYKAKEIVIGILTAALSPLLLGAFAVALGSAQPMQ